MAEDRDAILARRKFLIASALAAVSGCSKPEAPPEPQVCLKVAMPAEQERPGKYQGQPDPQAGDAAQAADAGAGDAAPPKPSR